VIVSVPLALCAIDSEDGEGESVKLGVDVAAEPPSGNWMLASSDCFNELGGVAS